MKYQGLERRQVPRENDVERDFLYAQVRKARRLMAEGEQTLCSISIDNEKGDEKVSKDKNNSKIEGKSI